MHDDPSHGENDADPNAVIEQVRELLFGEQRRASEAAMKALEGRLVALTATLEARFGDLERRIDEMKTQGESARDKHGDALGASLVELGERIRALSAPNKSGA